MDLILIITGGVLLGCLVGLSWFAGTDAPYVSTKTIRIKKILKEVRLKKGEIFWELGSGDGRVVLEAAKMGAKAYGIEQSWIRVLWSQWRARQQNLANAHFIHGDIFSLSFPRRSSTLRPPASSLRLEERESINRKIPDQVRNDIGNADVVFIFLLPKAVQKLEPLLKKNLKKGAKVITQTFHFKKWKPYKEVLVTDKNIPNTPLGKDRLEGDFYIYKI